MTREEFAKRIGWTRIIWTVGIINVTAMLPQLWQVLVTRETAGLSLAMVGVYGGIQVMFSVEGYFTRNVMLFVCMALSALVSTTLIGIVLYLRHFA